MLKFNDYQNIGLGLSGLGIVFLLLGMILFFDRLLLTVGNVLFLFGLIFVTGFERTGRFFFLPEKRKGSAFFFGGVSAVIFLGWPFIGALFELYGFYLLFSGFLPVVFSFLQRVPFVGAILKLPPFNKLIIYLTRGAGKSQI